MSRRQVIQVPGVEHKAPIPAAVRIGDLLFSSAINGRDPRSGEQPDGAREQVELAFQNMAAVVEAAGGTVADIAHVTVFLRDRADRKHVDERWLAMFPDPLDRPARHALPLDRAGGTLVQLEIVAVLEERARP
jgi:2-iminobutanoate/2-iminopropanoate deaminase